MCFPFHGKIFLGHSLIGLILFNWRKWGVGGGGGGGGERGG